MGIAEYMYKYECMYVGLCVVNVKAFKYSVYYTKLEQ
jgi:hypothetical protein